MIKFLQYCAIFGTGRPDNYEISNKFENNVKVFRQFEFDKNNMKKNNDNSTINGNIILTTTYVKINLIGQLDNKILDFKDKDIARILPTTSKTFTNNVKVLR
ncbi:hypothetical protein H8356DRAFT_1363570 [Neocallimastix lanati (nom. inval.)]|nr:hypothetical protein H8356DRAFT_1363570 [Neocallimastix sp. JGI-2020a]